MSKDEHKMESNEHSEYINANSKTTKFSSLIIKGISCLLIIITVFGVLFSISEDFGVTKNEFQDVPVLNIESTTPGNTKIIQETSIPFCNSQYFSAHHVLRKLNYFCLFFIIRQRRRT